MKRTDHDLGADPAPGASERDAIRQRLNALAWLLDNSIRLPGIGFRIGLDALLGLIPVVGDAVGVLISGYIVREAARLGVPRSTLLRMVANIVVEGVVGMFPLLGDVFDAAWKANQRNARLLNEHIANSGRAAASSRKFVLLLGAGLLAFLVLMGLFAALFWGWVLNLASAS